MARSVGPGDWVDLLVYATRESAGHVTAGHIDRSDATIMLITAATDVAGMPADHAGLLVPIRLGVELRKLNKAGV